MKAVLALTLVALLVCLAVASDDSGSKFGSGSRMGSGSKMGSGSMGSGGGFVSGLFSGFSVTGSINALINVLQKCVDDLKTGDEKLVNSTISTLNKVIHGLEQVVPSGSNSTESH